MIQKDIRTIVDNYTPAKYITSAVGTTTLYQYPHLSLVRTRVAGKDFYKGLYKKRPLAEEDAKKLFKEIEYGA
jgi:hypothetical protein